MKKTISTLILFLSLVSGAQAQQYQYRTYDVTRYGAKCDGTTDDSAAMTAAAAAAKADGGGEVRFPKGNCRGTLTITEARGLRFVGAGRFNSRITGTGGNPAVQVNGLWYSTFDGIFFTIDTARGSGAVFELDGNYDGSHTLGVQGNSFRDCYFDANNLAAYGLAIVRQGTGSGQGSENLFSNCHFQSATVAGVLSNGYNALQNTFLGGNFQGCKYGIWINAGSFNALSVGFQNALSGIRAQVESGGTDVLISNSADDNSSVRDCRSESAVFITTGNGHRIIYENNNAVSSGVSEWAPATAYSRGTLVKGKTVGNGDGRLYVCIGAGTSGASEPTWPATSPAYSIAGGGAISSGTSSFSCSGCGTLYNGYTGYGIIVRGAGAAGTDLYTTLATYVDNSSWTLGTNAGTTVASANWRIGATVTDGSATWIQYDYNEASFSGDSHVVNNKWGTGRINVGASTQYSTAYGFTFITNTLSRADWLYGVGTNYTNRLTAFGNTLRANGGPTTGKTASGYGLVYQNGGSTPATYTSPFTLGGQSLYWSGGSSGSNLPDIGFVPDFGTNKLSFNGVLVNSGTPQTLTGAGAVNLTTYTTLLVTTGTDALTLAAGSEGQTKFIRMKTDGGDGTLTVTNLQGGTTITFNDAGDFVVLFYQDAKWHILTNSGCVVA